MKKIASLGLLFAISLVFLSSLAYSQSEKVPGFPNNKLSTGSIDSQFIQLQNISKTMDQHKLIRRANLEQVRKNVADTLSQHNKSLRTALNDAQSKAAEVQVLQDSVAVLQETVKKHQNSENTINFLGFDFNKGFFSGLFIGLTLVLLIIILALIQQLRGNRTTMKESKSRVEEIQLAFDTHRKKALEKEQKLMRQLQDEINKKGGY